MTKTRKVTTISVGAATVFLLILEFVGVFAPGTADMISPMIWDISLDNPLVPFLFGGLMGHWFFPKGSCVHCKLRPWAKDENDNTFVTKLEAYFANRMNGITAGTAKLKVFGE